MATNTTRKVLKQTDILADGANFARDVDHPHWTDPKMEEVLVGCMLKESSYSEIESIVKPEMFSVDSFRAIAVAIKHLYDTGQRVDVMTIRTQMKEDGTFTDVSLSDIRAASKASTEFEEHVDYALKVRDFYLVRELRKSVKDWYTSSNVATSSPSELLSRLNGIASMTIQDEPNVFVPFHEIEFSMKAEEGFTTGFPKLDVKIQTGGYPAGQLSVIEAYHKGGKSTFMISSFIQQLMKGLDPVYISFADLNARRIGFRIMRNLTTHSVPDTCPSLESIQEWQKEYEHVCELAPRVYDFTKSESLRTVEGALRYLRGVANKRPVKVAFLDYFQRITTSDPKARTDYDKNKIVADKLANFAEETGIALVVGSQVTPGGKDRETISKGGRDIEENAGWVLRLKRDGDSDTIEVEIPFSRFGIQNTKPIQMTFDKDRLRVTQ